MLTMLVKPTITLPKTKQTIQLPHQPGKIHPLYTKLQLTAALVSGKQSKYQNKSMIPYWTLGGRKQEKNTTL